MNPRFKIGMRNVKTALAVGICLLFFQLIDIGSDINGVQAAVAATICMKSSLQNTVKTGLNRTVGTVIGSAMGILFLMLYNEIPEFLIAVVATFGVVVVIFLCNVLRLKASVPISVVVYLIILIGRHDIPPLFYGLARLGETVFGIFIAYIVNKFLTPSVFRGKWRAEMPAPDGCALRAFANDDIGAVMQIWLGCAVAANAFISETYWHGRYDAIRDAVKSAADTMVYTENGAVKGFISVEDESEIVALCVAAESRQAGIGTRLMAAAREKHQCLSAGVYKENEQGVQYFLNRGFFIAAEAPDATGHAVYTMEWSKKNLKPACAKP